MSANLSHRIETLLASYKLLSLSSIDRKAKNRTEGNIRLVHFSFAKQGRFTDISVRSALSECGNRESLLH